MASDVLTALTELRIEISADTRQRHLAAIEETLRGPRKRRTRPLVVLLAAVLFFLIPATALAERALPGDALYPLKKVTEPLRALVDSDVAARHRIEELDRLIELDADAMVIDLQIREAEAALTDTEDAGLHRELERLIDHVTPPIDEAPTSDTEPAPAAPVDEPSITEEVVDEPTDTFPSDRQTPPGDLRHLEPGAGSDGGAADADAGIDAPPPDFEEPDTSDTTTTRPHGDRARD